jgi:putative ABC transport system substrate-binding protein
MRRREFLGALAGAAAIGPFAAQAQQPAMPVIGFLNPTSSETNAERIRAFHRGLKDTGFVGGENLVIEYRFAEGQFDRLPVLAAELVRRQVAVIAANGPAALAAKAVTATIPIVFTIGDDPVRQGLVASLARPGGNLTGINFFSAEMAAKRLELLRELVPAATRVAVLVNPAGNNAEATSQDMQTAARAMGLQVRIIAASSSREINAAFDTFARERPDALLIGADPFFNSRRVQIVQLTARHALPAVYAARDNCEIGGLMSYGASTIDAFHQMGVYVGRIIRGAKPADMPVVQATKFELVINAETARMLGLAVPSALLARADEVIE